MKKNVLTTVEISDSHAKLVQSKLANNKSVLSACEVRPIDNMSDDQITKTVIEMVKSRQIVSEQFICIVPRRLIIIKQLRLPSQNEDEIRKMIELQLVNLIPYALTDVTFEFQVLQQEAEGYSHVMVGVIHKEVTQRYISIFKKAGISLHKIAVSSSGINDWFAFQLIHNKFFSIQPTVVVSIDVMQTEICFCQNKNLHFSRSVNIGLRDLTEENYASFIKQIDLSIQSYQKEKMGGAVEKIVLVATMLAFPGLKEELEKKFNLPIDIVSPMDNVLSQKKIDLATLKDQTGLSFTSSIGLHLTGAKSLMNLTPPEIHESKENKKKQHQVAKFFMLIFFIFLLGVALLGIDLFRTSNQLTEIKNKNEELELNLSKAQKQINFVAAFDMEFKNRIFVPDLILELHRLTPPEISYRSLILNDNNEFTIDGYAETSSSVNTIQGLLVKSPLFKEVNLQFATKRKIFKMEVTDFKFVTELDNVEGEE